MNLAETALVLRSGGHLAQAVEVAHQALAIARDAGEQMMLVLSLNYLGAALCVVIVYSSWVLQNIWKSWR